MQITKKIAILPGDGIGPEVMHGTLRVLDGIAERFGDKFEYLYAKIGGQAYDDCQSHFPQETLEVCRKADAILFGSVGGPVTEQHQEKWNNCAIQMIINPQQFDVMFTENMFGDIISDLAAALPGSLGLAPSASLSSERYR